MDALGPEWAESQIGRVVGQRWTLVKLLGVGGTAAVFEARHRNGKQVAVKVLRPERGREPKRRQRFLREGYAANRVGHPSVVGIDDDGEESDGTAYLVMELLAGQTLDEAARAQGGRLPWPTTVAYAAELLEVLVCAHQRGIVHRDIKPANLFVTDRGLRVLDFGLARVTAPDAESSLATADGAILGTPAFMAPEQARASVRSIGPATDIWAVGATAFALLTGRRVYEAPTVDEQLALAAASPPPLLARLCPDLPPAIAAVMQRALAHDPAERWSSAADMLQALRAACGEPQRSDRLPPTNDVTFLNTIAEERTRPRSKGPARRLVIGLVLVGVALLALAAWGTRRVETVQPITVTASFQPSRSARPAPPVGLDTLPVTRDDPAPVAADAGAPRSDRPSRERARPVVAERPPARDVPAPPGSARVAPPHASGTTWIEEPPF